MANMTRIRNSWFSNAIHLTGIILLFDTRVQPSRTSSSYLETDSVRLDIGSKVEQPFKLFHIDTNFLHNISLVKYNWSTMIVSGAFCR